MRRTPDRRQKKKVPKFCLSVEIIGGSWLMRPPMDVGRNQLIEHSPLRKLRQLSRRCISLSTRRCRGGQCMMVPRSDNLLWWRVIGSTNTVEELGLVETAIADVERTECLMPQQDVALTADKDLVCGNYNRIVYCRCRMIDHCGPKRRKGISKQTTAELDVLTTKVSGRQLGGGPFGPKEIWDFKGISQ